MKILSPPPRYTNTPITQTPLYLYHTCTYTFHYTKVPVPLLVWVAVGMLTFLSGTCVRVGKLTCPWTVLTPVARLMAGNC